MTTLPPSPLPQLNPPSWLLRFMDKVAATVLSIWLAGVLAGLGVACFKIALDFVAGDRDSSITVAEIPGELWALVRLVAITVGLFALPYLYLRFRVKAEDPAPSQTTAANPHPAAQAAPGSQSGQQGTAARKLTRKEKAQLMGLITTVALSLSGILISFTWDEISTAVLSDWADTLGDRGVAWIAMGSGFLLFLLSKAISPGLFHFLFEAIRRAISNASAP